MGIDIDKFAYSARLVEAQPLRLLIVGRLTEKKGIEFAIHAMSHVSPSVTLTIVGGGELEESLRALSDELRLSERVKFLGRRSNFEVNRLLRQTDVFLLPSITAASGDMEGMPVALMEAMAAGVLTISTWHSGIPELIEDRRSGFLVNERDVSNLARVIDEIDAGAFDLHSIRQHARTTVEERFNSRIEADRLLNELRGYRVDFATH